jgi:hypothetical protein
MNALYPARFDDDEAAKLDDALARLEGPERTAVQDALREHRRAGSQAEQLARLEELTTAPVTSLPFLFEAELGVDGVHELAAEIPV